MGKNEGKGEGYGKKGLGEKERSWERRKGLLRKGSGFERRKGMKEKVGMKEKEGNCERIKGKVRGERRHV